MYVYTLQFNQLVKRVEALEKQLKDGNSEIRKTDRSGGDSVPLDVGAACTARGSPGPQPGGAARPRIYGYLLCERPFECLCRPKPNQQCAWTKFEQSEAPGVVPSVPVRCPGKCLDPECVGGSCLLKTPQDRAKTSRRTRLSKARNGDRCTNCGFTEYLHLYPNDECPAS
jgi:hypothetical protein